MQNKNVKKSKTLGGIKVIEYCQMVSGPFCGKQLADMGATVIKIEPPDLGDAARKIGPFPEDIPNAEKSGLFIYLNSNKFGITLDLCKPEGVKIFKKLVMEADILIEDRSPGDMEKKGIDYKELKTINPRLIHASITNFGNSGHYKDYKAYQLNIAHVSGQGYLLPMPSPHLDRPPVKPGGNISDYDSGLVGFLAVLAALYRMRISGKGQFIDLSRQEALMSMQRVESVTYANDNFIVSRKGRIRPMPGGIMQCKDGHVVSIAPQEHQWEALMKLMGNPEWSKKDWCRDLQTRAENAQELTKLISAWMKNHTKEEIFRKGQALSCPISPLQTTEDVMNSRQLNETGFFVETDHPKAGKLKMPFVPYRFSKTPCKLERPAPLLGEHNKKVFCDDLGYTGKELVKLRQSGII